MAIEKSGSKIDEVLPVIYYYIVIYGRESRIVCRVSQFLSLIRWTKLSSLIRYVWRHWTYLRTRITIVVITAAKKTNPPKAPSATIAPKFNFALCVSRWSFSTGSGTFTLGDWSFLQRKKDKQEVREKTAQHNKLTLPLKLLATLIHLRSSWSNGVI